MNTTSDTSGGATGQTSPYHGLKVLDFTWAAAGPVVTTFLSFLGADVVKIENTNRPDLMRISDKQYGYGASRGINESPLFNELAAGKRSIELDLTNPDDLAVTKELAAVADVVVENMRPGKMEKLGLSYSKLSEKNPGLIMCSVSATGRSSVAGPPGYAPIFWAEGGGAWLTGWPQRPPGLVRGPIDLHAAAFACLGVLSLYQRRQRTGEGGYIDCSAVEAVATTIGLHLMEAQLDLDEPVRQGNYAPGVLLNDVFPCEGDDEHIAVTLHNEEEARKFVGVLRDNYGIFLTTDRILDPERGWETIADATRSIDASKLENCLTDAGIMSAHSTSMLRAMSDPRLKERAALQEIFHDTIGRQVIVGLPWVVDQSPYTVAGPAPVLGADRDDVMHEWLGVVHDA